MQDPPSPAAILDLITAQLDAPAPADDARAKFEQRLTAAARQLVQRAIELAPASDAAERERLSALLGETGSLGQLNRRLCILIRDGALALSVPGLTAHLRATTLEKLAIDQPNYAAYRRAVERSED